MSGLGDPLLIIKWLNIKRNYDSCFGTGKAPAINLNPCKMKDQFNTYKDKYKKVHTKSISTGFGLTNEDQKVGISTINEKLESMFPHYHEMNELMGGQAFINPWFKVDGKADKNGGVRLPRTSLTAAAEGVRPMKPPCPNQTLGFGTMQLVAMLWCMACLLGSAMLNDCKLTNYCFFLCNNQLLEKKTTGECRQQITCGAHLTVLGFCERERTSAHKLRCQNPTCGGEVNLEVMGCPMRH
ncbi:hypothetical protein VP01_1264g2 [Puccinia sorghi]|uniref:Uncharacterized protein n=1 Tax=Puccinia sorghi TaxID=27349 RepID=A0A0L6VP52_9BASI|nr:hypothetical protein VP01_1264g2 [Puccinia sorghi]